MPLACSAKIVKVLSGLPSTKYKTLENYHIYGVIYWLSVYFTLNADLLELWHLAFKQIYTARQVMTVWVNWDSSTSALRNSSTQTLKFDT